MAASKNLHKAVAHRHHLRARVRAQLQGHRVTAVGALGKVLLTHAYGRNLRGGEDVRGNLIGTQRAHRITENVRHSDTALHRSHGSQRVHARAVAGGINAVHARTGHTVHLNMTARGLLNTDVFQAQIFSVRNRTNSNQTVSARNLTTIRQSHNNAGAILSTLNSSRTGTRHHSHAATLKDVLQHTSCVLILAGKHAVTRRHQGHLRTQTVIRRSELRTGHTRTNHNQFLGNLGEVVQLSPGQNAFAVRHTGRHFTRMRTHRQQHKVRVQGVDEARLISHLDSVAVQELTGTVNNLHSCRGQGTLNVGRLLLGQVADSAVHAVHINTKLRRLTLRVFNAQATRLGEAGHHIRRSNQGLRGHNVSQNGGATNGIAFDQSHVRVGCGSHHRCLIAAGATTNNYNSLRCVVHL